MTFKALDICSRAKIILKSLPIVLIVSAQSLYLVSHYLVSARPKRLPHLPSHPGTDPGTDDFIWIMLGGPD